MAPTDMSGTFSITPAEIASTASTWQRQGAVVAELDFSALTDVSGAGARTFAAIKGCDVNAKAATDSIGTRLITMGISLHLFTATTVDNDRCVAEAFASLTSR